jgi:hypothetical protein
MKGRIRRGLAALAFGAVLIPGLAGTANAAPLPIICTAAGTVVFTNGTPDTWSISGRGSCQGDLQGTYFLDFNGFGTSKTTGLCDPGLLVQDLNINVVGTLTNTQTLGVKFINQDWVAPLTTYPLVTPFLIQPNASDDEIGAGVFFNHIFLICTGPTVAQFDFAFFP